MSFAVKLGLPLAAAVMIILTPCSGYAHSAPRKPVAAHGGVVAQTEQFNLELIAMDGVLELYVRDRHDRVADARDCVGSALIWETDKTVALNFEPGSGAGLIRAVGDFSASAIRRVIVSIKVPGYEAQKAWFTGFDNGAR